VITAAVPSYSHLPLPSTSFAIHYSSLLLPLDTAFSELLTASLVKPEVGKWVEHCSEKLLKGWATAKQKVK
jgi:hypothetical protein